MIIKTANYVGSFVELDKCPQGKAPEFAFIGRSNVGKSSLINLLTGRKELALTSAKPGKTQTINYFHINEQWYLVDLPGYGYARVSREQRGKWEAMISHFLTNREQIICVFQLVDAGIPPQTLDLDFSNWLGENGIPFAIIFTKADKRPKGPKGNVEAYQQEMLKQWETLPPMFTTSATKRIGRDEVLGYLDTILAGL
ncbi:MAG TPA: ribosome biogenesis GTP-binding protein YihA/YsxC [Chitinophagales bacterium]|nr:ribosome biogenesis GTP-binding protein YihA/YsxC [Chitinophagales bacterium]